MGHDAGAVVNVTAVPVRRPPTFLGSETAPDDGQIRQRLTEIRQTSQRRRNGAKWALAAGALAAVVLTSLVSPHPAREGRGN